MDEIINKLKEQIKLAKSPNEKAGLLLDLARSLRYDNIEDAKRYASQAIAIAEEIKDNRVKGTGLGFLCDIFYQEGKIEDSIELAKKLLKFSKIYENKYLEALANTFIGLCFEQKGEIEHAINHFEKSNDFLLEIGNSGSLLSSNYNNLGNAFWDKGDLEKALEYHQKSLAMKEKLRDDTIKSPDSNEIDPIVISQKISISQNNLGLLYEDMGDLEKAIEFFYRSLVEKEKSNERAGIPTCYNNIGEIYLKRGRLEKAIQLFEQAIKTAEDVKAMPKKAEACGNLGNAHFLSGDYIRAMNYYVEDMNLSSEIDDKFELSEVYWRMGELLLATKEEKEAFDFIKKSVGLSSEIGAKKNEASAQRILGKYYAQQKDLANASNAFEQGIEILKEMGRCFELGKLYFDYGNFLVETGARDNALRYFREAATIFRKLEIVPESEAIERLLFQLELEKDRRLALIKSLSSLTSYLLPVSELAPKCLNLLQDAMVFDAGAFYSFETKPYVLGNITKEEAMKICRRGETEFTNLSVNLPLRLAGQEVGVLHLKWKTTPSFNLDPALFESIGNILSLALEHSRSRIGLKPTPIKEVIAKPIYRFEGLVGNGPKMLRIYDTILKVAPTKACVLIRGESGTGKEIIAKTIHNQSPRASKPFVTINCAAIPENLLESELFGVEKGTATGVTERKGKFEWAHTGTIFLDEIGDMSLSLQAKLLRVLQEKEFERLGGRKTIEVDVRIIAATNKDLEREIAKGHFREDLFYRLNVISIHLPPLRERKEDIPQLVNHFIKKFNVEMDRSIIGANQEAMEMILNYSWPGNVRELENAIERAVILVKQDTITLDDLPPVLTKSIFEEPKHLLTATDLKEAKENLPEDAKASLEKNFILQLLDRHNWNVTRAVKASGISRSKFYRLLEKYQIKRTEVI